MDKAKLKSLFDEVLEKYRGSEECAIYNMSGKIEEEQEELKKEIEEYQKRFSEIFSDAYLEEGIVIYVKGFPVIQIHPDNVENNVKALQSGEMRFDWEYLLRAANNRNSN